MENNIQHKLIILLSGLPGAGKTTFSKRFKQFFEKEEISINNAKIKCIVEIISADNIECKLKSEKESNNFDFDSKIWKMAQKEIYEITKNSIMKEIAYNELLILLVDDNFYFNSMKKEFLQLTRAFNQSLMCIHFQVPLEICLKRNANRISNEKVPEFVIKSINSKFEILKSKEFLTLVIENVNEGGFGCFDTSTNFTNFTHPTHSETSLISGTSVISEISGTSGTFGTSGKSETSETSGTYGENNFSNFSNFDNLNNFNNFNKGDFIKCQNLKCLVNSVEYSINHPLQNKVEIDNEILMNIQNEKLKDQKITKESAHHQFDLILRKLVREKILMIKAENGEIDEKTKNSLLNIKNKLIAEAKIDFPYSIPFDENEISLIFDQHFSSIYLHP